jgi:hypothetical protein
MNIFGFFMMLLVVVFPINLVALTHKNFEQLKDRTSADCLTYGSYLKEIKI